MALRSTMSALLRMGRAVGKGLQLVETALGYLGMAMLFVMMVLGAADVIGRYVFNSPITGTLEVSQLCMGGTVFLGWAYTLSQKAHLVVDLVSNHYPQRVQRALDFIMLLGAIGLFSLIAWQSALVGMKAWDTGELMKTILIPIAPFKWLITVGAGLLVAEGMLQLIRLVPQIVGKGGE